jgi:hypothetical protein
MPRENAPTTAQNSQSDVQYQDSKIATLEPTAKPLHSLVSGTKVTHLDLYYFHDGDIELVDRTDAYGELVGKKEKVMILAVELDHSSFAIVEASCN